MIIVPVKEGENIERALKKFRERPRKLASSRKFAAVSSLTSHLL